MKVQKTSLWLALSVAAALAGCSTAAPPRENVAAADLAVKRALDSRRRWSLRPSTYASQSTNWTGPKLRCRRKTTFARAASPRRRS